MFEKWNTEAVLHGKEKPQNAKAKALKDFEERTCQEKKKGSNGNVQMVACPPSSPSKVRVPAAPAAMPIPPRQLYKTVTMKNLMKQRKRLDRWHSSGPRLL